MGIAGTGGMAEYQARKFAALPGCILTACKDHKPDHGQVFAARHGMISVYQSIDAMLDSGCCDALSCAVIDGRHRAIVEACLVRGIPVLCEKPLARTLRDCEALARLAQRSGIPCRVNFSKRNAPALEALRRLVVEGQLGTILEVRAEYLQSWVASRAWGDWLEVPRWRWRLMPSSSTAGVIGDLGSHLVDALLYVFGDLQVMTPGTIMLLDEALSRGLVSPGSLSGGVLSEEFLEPPGPVCVDFEALATLSKDCPVSLRLSWIAPGETDTFRIKVRGSRAEATLDLGISRTKVEVLEAGTGLSRSVAGESLPDSYAAFLELCEGWLVSRTSPPAPEGGPMLPDFKQGLRVQRMLDSLYPGGLPE
jgi:predicted dehydrogenase